MAHIKRDHPLFIGEKVFCCGDLMCWVEIIGLNGRYAIVKAQTGDVFTVSRASLYQKVKDRVCHRMKTAICYEHQTNINYPYYCPALDENLYGFETDKV